MPIYLVTHRHDDWDRYLVEADSSDDVEQIVLDGEAEELIGGCDWHAFEFSEVTVEEANQLRAHFGGKGPILNSR